MNEETKVLEGELIQKRMGRPSEYRSEYVDMVRELGKHGRITKAAICAQLDIVPDTYYRWQEIYPEFEEAVTMAVHVDGKAYWEERLMNQAEGKEKGNQVATIFFMSNVFKEDYKQRNDSSNSNININLTTKNLSIDQLEEQIKLKEEKIKQLENK